MFAIIDHNEREREREKKWAINQPKQNKKLHLQWSLVYGVWHLML